MHSRRGGRVFQQTLKGKDGTIRRLESRINALQAENEVLRIEQQQSKAESQLRKELDALQSAFEAEVERRKQLAKNNQSLGGRVAHLTARHISSETVMRQPAVGTGVAVAAGQSA